MKWKFKKDAEPQGQGDFWYDVTAGGYIDLSACLSGEQLKAAKVAVKLLSSLEDAMREAELLKEY